MWLRDCFCVREKHSLLASEHLPFFYFLLMDIIENIQIHELELERQLMHKYHVLAHWATGAPWKTTCVLDITLMVNTILLFLTANLQKSSLENTGIILVEKIGTSSKHCGGSMTSWGRWQFRSASSCWIFLSFSSRAASSWMILSVWSESCMESSVIKLTFLSPSSSGRRLSQHSSSKLAAEESRRRTFWAVLIGVPRT